MLPTPYFIPLHKRLRVGFHAETLKRKRDESNIQGDKASVSEEPRRRRESLSDGGSSTLGHSPAASVSGESEAPKSTTDKVDDASSLIRDGPLGGWVRSRRRRSGYRISKSLGKLKPPLLGPGQSLPPGLPESLGPKGSGARQRHLAVLTTILHRSLLRHDYKRAGRVWGLLLRSEMNSHSVDLRHGFKWGLGAEILLRQQSEVLQSNDNHTTVVGLGTCVSTDSCQYINSDGFDRVRQYYDRLSLQYPYHKSFPDATGPLDFRFAMFSLWIYLCHRRKPLNMGTHETALVDDPEIYPEIGEVQESQEGVLYLAREISRQLDELVSSPPYSDSEKFQKIKAMVDLWTADLSIAN